MRRLVARAFHLYARFARGLTGGVRVLVTDGERVLLVRHSYVHGLHLPGGGVEVGETFEQAALKELREEAALTPTAPLELFGLYLNEGVTRRDHVAVFVCRDFAWDGFEPTAEIVEAGFHPLADLPADVTEPTLRRIAEVREGRRPDPYWWPRSETADGAPPDAAQKSRSA